MSLLKSEVYTLDDIYALPEGQRAELIDGKINTYIEPFIGGGAVFFSMLSKYNFDRVVINDINSELILTYKVIKEAPEKLINILDKCQNKI